MKVLLKRIGVLQHKFEVLGGWSIETNAKRILDGLGFKEYQFNEKLLLYQVGGVCESSFGFYSFAGSRHYNFR